MRFQVLVLALLTAVVHGCYPECGTDPEAWQSQYHDPAPDPKKLEIDTLVHREEYDGWQYNQILEDGGTSCTLCLKNGYLPTNCHNGARSSTAYAWYYGLQSKTTEETEFVFPEDQQDYVSLEHSTFLWTNCHDALLIDWARLGTWSHRNTWGSNDDMAWCLSLDQHDNWDDWDPRIDANANDHGAGRCYTTLRFDPDGDVNGYHEVRAGYGQSFSNWLRNFAWGRRSLQEVDVDAVPSVADFNACEADDSISDAECDALVDQILTWQIEHAELWADAGRVPLHDEDTQITDHVYSLDDESSTEDAESSTDNAESSTDNAESSTENAESSTENAESSTENAEGNLRQRRKL